MTRTVSFPVTPQWHCHLLALSVGVAVAALATLSHDPRQIITGIPEVIIPLGIATALGLFSLKLHWHGYESTFIKDTVKYSWAGGLIAAAVGGWWIVIHYYFEMPTIGLPEQILTLISGGIGAGVVLGYTQAETASETPPAPDTRLLTQTTWTNRSGDTPILAAIVDALADIDRTDATELDPLYNHINPDAFTELRQHDSSPWHLHFYTDDYTVEVTSTGTVTIYDPDTPPEQPHLTVTRHEDNPDTTNR